MARTARQIAASRRNLAKARRARRKGYGKGELARRRARRSKRITYALGAAAVGLHVASEISTRKARNKGGLRQAEKGFRRGAKRARHYAAADARTMNRMRRKAGYSGNRVVSHRGVSRPLNPPRAITGHRTRALAR